MMTGKNQAGQQLTAFGSMLQASTYGMAIPVIFGRTISPLLAIWAANLRQGGSVKKFKQLKKGITAYCENIDFLIGKNPILGVLQFWVNNGKYPLNFTSTTFSTSSGSAAFTITDPHFYAVIGVSISSTFTATENFDDYGGAPQTVTGYLEFPLWNQLVAGPDPTDNSGQRNYPNCYRWQPSYGSTFYIDANGDSIGGMGGTVTVYYAQLMAATSYVPPISKLRMQFENVLGSGTEYAGFSGQQIEYPWYAGVGSDSLDLGSSGAIPSISPEVQGKYGTYASGDCDFVDMIEDILKSGITQSAIGGTLGFGPTQHGVGCFDFPGAVQKRYSERPQGNNPPLAFDMPNTAGNVLLAFCATGTAGPLTVSDTLGNTWTLASRGTVTAGCYALYYATNCLAGTNAVTFAGGFYGTVMWVMELAGVDSFDAAAVATGTNPVASLTTTNASGSPSIILGVSIEDPFAATPGQTNLWPVILGPLQFVTSTVFAQQRTVTQPGTYSLGWGGSRAGVIVLLSFKATQPATYPNPLPNLLDPVSRELTRQQCRAGGLWGSLSMNSQKAASEWIKDLVMAANCAPVWSGMRLKLIPRSEVSAVGNGAVYHSPTATGPAADLDADLGDFIASPGEAPLTVVRTARTDLNTVLQMQHLNRTSDYQQIVSAVSDPASVAKYGVRKADPIVNNAIQDVAVATPLLRIAVRRQNYVDPVKYQLKLNARWQLLEPMDLVTLTDRLQGIVKVPVRLTSVEEDDKFDLTCEAEPFIYGVSAPQTLAVTQPTPYRPSPDASAGNVNAPVIFEPVVRLYGAQNQAQLWLVVSSASTAYGGCQVMISTDGGSSYNSAGDPIVGNGVTGATVGTWAGAASPDTTNDLAVDLTESLGVLASYQVADEDNFVYPCYVAGTSTPIPYELMTYAVATMTAANKYTLKATGGNHLDRGVFGAPTLGTGATHASGSRFAFLPPDGLGILKMQMDPLWVGKTLYFKFLSFNNFGGAVQALGDVSPYTYTPTGGSGSVNPIGLPPQSFQVNGV